MFFNYVFDPYDEIYPPCPKSYKKELKDNVNRKEGEPEIPIEPVEFHIPQRPFDFKNIADFGLKEFDFDLSTNPEKIIIIGSKLTTDIMQGNM